MALDVLTCYDPFANYQEWFQWDSRWLNGTRVHQGLNTSICCFTSPYSLIDMASRNSLRKIPSSSTSSPSVNAYSRWLHLLPGDQHAQEIRVPTRQKHRQDIQMEENEFSYLHPQNQCESRLFSGYRAE